MLSLHLNCSKLARDLLFCKHETDRYITNEEDQKNLCKSCGCEAIHVPGGVSHPEVHTHLCCGDDNTDRECHLLIVHHFGFLKSDNGEFDNHARYKDYV